MLASGRDQAAELQLQAAGSARRARRAIAAGSCRRQVPKREGQPRHARERFQCRGRAPDLLTPSRRPTVRQFWSAARLRAPRHTDGVRLADFYEQDSRRAPSDEVAYGVDWRRADGKGTWNVWAIRDTGELVAYQTGRVANSGASTWSLLGDIVSSAAEAAETCDARREELTVLLTEPDEMVLQARLEGWREHVGEADGFSWLLDATGPDRTASSSRTRDPETS